MSRHKTVHTITVKTIKNRRHYVNFTTEYQQIKWIYYSNSYKTTRTNGNYIHTYEIVKSNETERNNDMEVSSRM